MRTEWLRSNLPDSLTRGARAVCGYKLTSCNVSDKTIYARGVLQPKSECHAFFDLLRSVYSRQSVCSANIRCSVLWKGSRVLSGKTIPFQENPRPFPVGSKFPPFLYVLTIFLQMKAHDILHKTWKVSSSTPKSHEKSLSIVFVGNTHLKWSLLPHLRWPYCNHAKWSYLILFFSLSFWCKSRILICKLFLTK